MKRSFIILLVGLVGLVTIFFFRPKPPAINSSASMFQLTNMTTVIESNTGSIIKTQTIHQNAVSQNSTNTEKTILNVIGASAQNIEGWKAAIPNLRNDPINKKNWVMWQNLTNAGLPFSVGDTGDSWVEFDSNFININTKKDSDDIRRIEIQSVWMNITDARSLGDSLLQIMGSDNTSFNYWCDKVGNSWVDKPEFTSHFSPLPNSNKIYGFQVRSTFNNEKPWYILLIIRDK